MTDTSFLKRKKKNKQSRSGWIRNIVQFIIGLILLGFVGSYLQGHQAERETFFNGFTFLYHKAQSIFYTGIMRDEGKAAKIRDKNDTLQKLEQLEGIYASGCGSNDDLININATMDQIQKESLDEYLAKRDEYTLITYTLFTQAKKTCEQITIDIVGTQGA